MKLFACCLLSVLMRLRHLQASDHVLYQLNKYASNSIITGLSQKYQDLPCEITQTYHWVISVVSYTAALLLLIDQAPALKMEFKLLEAENTEERLWFRAFHCPNCLSGDSTQSRILILSVLTNFVQERHLSPVFLYVCM